MPLARARLVEADRQIADLKRELEQHRDRITVLKANGHYVAEAEATLGEVEQALQRLIDYRDLLAGRMPSRPK